MALLPIPLVWQLQLNKRKKITLILILALGFFTGVAGIVKAMWQNSAAGDPDQYVRDPIMIWWFVELSVGMVAASLPALKPLFRRVLDTARGNTTRGEKNSGRRYPSDLGYLKQQDARSDEGIMMDYMADGNNKVEVSSAKPGGHDEEAPAWRALHTKEYEVDPEAVRRNNKSNAIYVTRDVRVD